VRTRASNRIGTAEGGAGTVSPLGPDRAGKRRRYLVDTRIGGRLTLAGRAAESVPRTAVAASGKHAIPPARLFDVRCAGRRELPGEC
jgi:hypothetical protein